jgi:hypothetical protein
MTFVTRWSHICTEMAPALLPYGAQPRPFFVAKANHVPMGVGLEQELEIDRI